MSLASYVEMEAVRCGGSVPKTRCCSPGRLCVRWLKLCSDKQELRHLMMGSTAADSFKCRADRAECFSGSCSFHKNSPFPAFPGEEMLKVPSCSVG